jgi:hypothetical protein
LGDVVLDDGERVEGILFPEELAKIIAISPITGVGGATPTTRAAVDLFVIRCS